MNTQVIGWYEEAIYVIAAIFALFLIRELVNRFQRRKKLGRLKVQFSMSSSKEFQSNAHEGSYKILCHAENVNGSKRQVVDEFVLFLGSQPYSLSSGQLMASRVLPVALKRGESVQEAYFLNPELLATIREFASERGFRPRQIQAGVRAGDDYYKGNVDPNLIEALLS